MNDDVFQYVGKTIRIFLSHSTKDLNIVRFIKSDLESYGMDVFVAHEDIKPSSEWENAILQNLNSTDIFIPVITENYYDSSWTDQESGIAFSKSKLIIPVSINGYLPRGFLNRFQALRFKNDSLENAEKSCTVIFETIKNRNELASAVLDSVISTLPKIHSFDQAGYKFRILSSFNEYSQEQINALIYFSINNSQIYGSGTARGNLNLIINKFKNIISEELLKNLLSVM